MLGEGRVGHVDDVVLGLAEDAALLLEGADDPLGVAADAALKHSLAGEAGAVVSVAADSSIPMIGQAVLGFVLPWLLALVAIPLEMLLDSGRHVMAQLSVFFLHFVGGTVRVLGHAVCSLVAALPSLYDVYIAIPLRIERLWRDPDEDVVAYAEARAKSGEHPATRPGLA